VSGVSAKIALYKYSSFPFLSLFVTCVMLFASREAVLPF